MRDAKDLKSMDGVKYVASVPDGEIIISMCVSNGVLFIATSKHIYMMVDNKRLERVE